MPDAEQRAFDLIVQADLSPADLRALLVAASAPADGHHVTRRLGQHGIQAGVLNWDRVVELLERRMGVREPLSAPAGRAVQDG